MRKVLLLLCCLSFLVADAQRSGINWPGGFYINGPTSINAGKDVWPPASAAIKIGKDSSNLGAILPRVVHGAVVTTERGVFFYDYSDSTLHHMDGSVDVRYMTYKDTNLVKTLIQKYAPGGDGGGQTLKAGYGINIDGDTIRVDTSAVPNYLVIADTAQALRSYIINVVNSLAFTSSKTGSVVTITMSNGASVSFNISDKDSSNTNEIQTLSISNDTLFLTGSGFVKLPVETDPVFASSAASSITNTQITDWDAHLTDNTNPHSTTLDQVAKENPVTDTSLFIGWQDPGGIISLFGNSITADIYTNPPPVPYYKHLAYRHGQTVKVHAHGGATYYRGYTPHNNNGGLMDSVASLEVMPTPNSKLIIELGFNDGCQYATSYDTTQIKLSLDSFVAQADIKGWMRGSIGALSAWYIPNPALCSSMTDNDLIIINTAIRNECFQLGIHYIDLHTIFANNQKRNLYFTDNVHWSALGHYICADEVDKEMYPQVYVKGNLLVDGGLYDYRGHQVISIDTSGRKVIEGETGFDVLPDGKALVTVPFTKNYAGMRASGVTFQGLSTYNYFIGFNLHHNGTTYVTDTPGYSGMIQFADGEISYWQSTGSNTAGAAPTLEKRYKFSSNSRGFGFGGNPGNGGRDDFSGSAMQGDASKLQFNFATKFKYAPANADALFEILVRHTPDSNTQTISSLPYSFIANRLKYSGGAAFYVPVFSSSDSLVASHIQDSAGFIGIDTVASPLTLLNIPVSNTKLSAAIGSFYFQSINANNIALSNNSYFVQGSGTKAIHDGYAVNISMYNSATANGGAGITMWATPSFQTAGQNLTGSYPFFRMTPWGTIALGYQNSTSAKDTIAAALIVTNTTATPNSASQVFLPNTQQYTGTIPLYMVLDSSSSTGQIPTKKVTWLKTIPQSGITGLSDSLNKRVYSLKRSNDSVFANIGGTWIFQYKDSTMAAGSGVASVTATSPMSSSGGTNPNITLDTTTTSGGWHSYNYYKTVFANITHTHAESDIINLTTDLAGKAALSHTHGMSDLTGFNITTPSDGQLVKYDFASGKWVNFTPSYLTSVADATTSTKGIASFSSTYFSVTSGAVSIKTGGIGSTEIADGSVALADMANMATASVIGRNTAGTGAPEVLSIATLKTILAYTKADIGLTNVENTALSTWTGSSNINTVGTIGTGTWQGSTINTTYIDKSININAQTGTTYTLQASDLGKIVQCTNASAITVTLPSGLGASFWCIIKQGGAGAVTLAASGTTIHNRQSYTKTAGQYASFIILPESTSNNYSTQGDMQ